MATTTKQKSKSKSKYRVAYAWASGLIEFGDKLPEGALPIAAIPAGNTKVFAAIKVLARRGIGASEDKLLVPGVPEALNEDLATSALVTFVQRVHERIKPKKKAKKV